jgi:hypothetical protein
MLSDEQISNFRVLYKNRFGKDISREEALEKGVKLLRLVQLVYKPITEEEYTCLRERKIKIKHKNEHRRTI